MFGVGVAALFSDFVHRQCGGGEYFSCEQKPVFDYVLHAGNSVLLLIQFLQMPRADVQLFCHIWHIPRGSRIIFDVHVELLQCQLSKVLCFVREGFPQFGKQNLEQGLDGKLPELILKKIFDGKQVNQLADVKVVECFKGSGIRDCAIADKRLVGVKPHPVITEWFILKGAVFNVRMGRIQNNGMGGHQYFLSVSDIISRCLAHREQPEVICLIDDILEAGRMSHIILNI